jgi:rubrerythrin
MTKTKGDTKMTMKNNTTEQINSSVQQHGIKRRNLLAMIGAGLSGAALMSLGGTAFAKSSPIFINQNKAISDKDILNFALNLEYLESEFYTYAVTGQGIEALGIATNGTGSAGATTNGKKVKFTDPILEAVAQELAFDEQQHVKLLRSVLGKDAIAKPAIDLNALGMGFGSEAEYLTIGRALEDTGISAYGGAAPLIKSKEILSVAGRILADEAYHMGNVRLLIAQKGVRVKALDDKDVLPPPSGKKFFAVDNDALSIIRTPAEVLAIAKAFYPKGVNGAIRG